MGYRDRRDSRAPTPINYEPPRREAAQDRAPLQWATERRIECGRVVLVLQSAQLDSGGTRRSFRVGKDSREYPDKPFPFMDPRDLHDLRSALDEMEEYLGL